MKAIFLITILLIASSFLNAQVKHVPAKSDQIFPAKGNRDKQQEKIKPGREVLRSDKSGSENEKSARIDTTLQNRYGNLLDDDPEYNKKYSVVRTAMGASAGLLTTWLFDRYALKADYAKVGFDTWGHNLKYGWEWDNDGFGINFVGHPYSGALSYSAARSNGYNYFASLGFAAGGSLMWEYFAENTRPSYNDIVNTPISGAFLGEVLHRLSSNVLDDRTRGRERVFREIAAGIIDPMRGINRLFQGKTFRITDKEVYEKEPLNISLYAGLHSISKDKSSPFEKGTNNVMFNAQFDYGNPFEIRKRKPFDFFRLRTDFNFGVGKKFLDNVTGYGILFGKNSQVGKVAILAGAFQSYDYWDNSTFVLGTIGLGGGIFSKMQLSTKSNLYTNLHLGIIPLAGNSTDIITDTATVRNYNFGGGIQGKFATALNLGKYLEVSLIYYNYLIHTYYGAPGTNFIQIFKPRVTVQLYHALRIGFENYIYTNDQYLSGYPALHRVQTEQKIFFLLYFEDHQRKGRYN